MSEPGDEGEEKQEPAHMEGFQTEYAPRENGRLRRRGLNKAIEEGAEGFFLRYSTLSPLGIHVDPEQARCDLTTFTPTPLSWHQPSPLKPEGPRCSALVVHKQSKEKRMIPCSGSDIARALHCNYACTIEILSYAIDFHVTFGIKCPYEINAYGKNN